MLFAANYILGRSLLFTKFNHLNFFFQGFFNFSLNYILTYTAETYSPSAVIALTSTTLVHLNILGTWYFFKKPIHKNVVFGALFGATGIYFLFFDDIYSTQLQSKNIIGVALGLLAAGFASAGNMLSYRNHLKKIPVMASNAWAMFYGMIITGLLALAFSQPFLIPTTLRFWSSLFYLSIFGTVIAFGAYYTLINNIGAEKAAYISILSPVIALAISASYENLNITPVLMFGVFLCLIGNVLTLYRAGKNIPISEPPP